ncbi:MAG: fibronectin type III domain-containing protein [Verrucomicrobiota bacterium]
MVINYRTSLAFTRLKDADLLTFADSVVAGLTGNASFPTPIVALPDLTAAVTDFRNAMAAAEDGGKRAIAARDAARAVLVGLLRQLAAYVESLAGEDLPMLLSSGFQAVNTNRTRIVLPKPVILDLANEQSTMLAMRLQAVPTARSYEVRISDGANGWRTVGIFTQARRILLENLTPGTVYTVQVRAIGGITGSSDWSDPVSHMAL